MDPKGGRQFRHRALALQRLKCNPRLERRVVVPAFRHVLFSSFLETSRRQIVASVTVRFSGSSSTQGFLMQAIVHSAGIQDRDGGVLLMGALFGRYPSLLKLYADSGYQGPKFQEA